MLSSVQFGHLHRQLAQQGGFTINTRTGEQPTHGVMVADAAHERVVPSRGTTAGTIERYAHDKAAPLAQQGAHLGAWRNEGDGSDYFDVSHRVENGTAPLAVHAAMIKHDQQAAYDIGAGTEIPNPYHGRPGAGIKAMRSFVSGLD